MHHVELSRRALTQTRRYMVVDPVHAAQQYGMPASTLRMTRAQASPSITILTTRNPPTQQLK